jgi:hypothetical protein
VREGKRRGGRRKEEGGAEDVGGVDRMRGESRESDI